MADKSDKKITMDGLARIINKGFNGQMEYMKKEFDKLATKDQFNGLDKRLSVVEKDVKYIKENLASSAELEKDVEYIKNTLNIPAMKK